MTGRVSYARDRQHTFFKTLWQSLLEGIKQCAGISADREAKLVGTAEVATDLVKGTKSVVRKTGGFIKKLFKRKDQNDAVQA